MFMHGFAGSRKGLLVGAIAGAMLLLSIVVVFAQGPRPRPAAGSGPRSPQAALGTGFTYQGNLKKNGSAVNDPNCSMTFSLWDSQSNGLQIGGDQSINPVAVADGSFTVLLNGAGEFGASAFDGSDRWLQAAVMCAGDVGAVSLSRQQLTAAPNALFSAAPWVSGGGNLFYNAGNVGIGTTTPAHHLSIIGGPSWTSNSWSGALELSNSAALGWQANSGGQRFGLGQTNGGLYFFRTASNPGTTASPAIYDMVIADGGNVGIGTINPTSRLEVNGVTRLTPGGAETDMVLGAPNGETGILIRGPNRADMRFDGTTLKLVAGAGTLPPASTSGINIDTSGKVGIGTTAPGEKLAVLGPDNLQATNIGRFLSNNSVESVGIGYEDIRQVAASGPLNVNAGSTGVVNIGNSSSGGVILATGGGNVGIGLNNPVDTLDVNGGIRALGITDFGNFSFQTTASVGQTALCYNGGTLKTLATCSSSLRYKTNVQPYAGGMDVVNRLRPITFNWKDGGAPDLGLGAEDVAAIEPLLVTHNDSGAVEGVKYERMAAVFVNALQSQQTQLQQQQAQLDRQQAQIDRQQSQIASQQVQMDGLKALVCLDHPDAALCK